MRFILDLQIDNDSFILGDAGPNGDRYDGDELARILRCAADALDGNPIAQNDSDCCRDRNGNTVGSWCVVDRAASEG